MSLRQELPLTTSSSDPVGAPGPDEATDHGPRVHGIVAALESTRRRPVVLLDRDGVLNESVSRNGGQGPPWTLDEVRFLHGAVEACRRLRAAGHALAVCTNQPDVGAGRVAVDVVDAINEHVRTTMGADLVLACTHRTADRCRCKKPAPGMLRLAAELLRADPDHLYLVGDRWVDIAAGRAIGATTVLIETPSSWSPTSAGSPPAGLEPDLTFAGLAEWVDRHFAQPVG